ncbi:glycosyltransferase family 2 protein [Patescibacteria group bacterium]|nr:glycosyltransferase family 2 protein [Patescibacteria group bacterium]
MPKTAIIYLVWSDEPKKYLSRALLGIAEQTCSKENLHLLVVYNAHKPEEESQINFIREEIEKNKDNLPPVTILEQEKNLGFSGGNNLGMKWAVDNGFDYVFLHNADGYLADKTIEQLVQTAEIDKKIGQLQPLVLLHPETDLINSAGNNWHYLGIGYCDKFRKKVGEFFLPKIKDVGYVSGAATLLRADLLKEFGYWNEDFFLYHEDTEYSWRLKIRGYRTVMVSDAEFYHIYEFKKNIKKYYWMERNRQIVKLLLYRWPTLILLLPLEILYNLGLLVVALAGGWSKELVNAWVYWLKAVNWKNWLKERAKYQADRKLSDRDVLKIAVPMVDSGDLVVSKPINALANLVFTFYYFLLKIIVWW